MRPTLGTRLQGVDCRQAEEANMPLEVFLGAIIINRRIAVPALALLATFLRRNSLSGSEIFGFFLYACLYGFVGWILRHYLQEEIVEIITDRRNNIRLAEEREREADLNWPVRVPRKVKPE
jgi:hypothetical protein